MNLVQGPTDPKCIENTLRAAKYCRQDPKYAEAMAWAAHTVVDGDVDGLKMLAPWLGILCARRD